MTTHPQPALPASRLATWLVGCVAAGWLVVYNLMRIGGASPSDAALPALGAGAVAGVVVFGAGYLVVRRLAASGRVVTPGHREIPSPSEMDQAQRDSLKLAFPALALLSVAALAVGAYLAVDWFGDDSGGRPTTTIVLAAWNVLAGLWLGDETLRLQRGEADGIDSVPLGCGLTALLAGVGLSRDLVEAAQIVLIVLGGVAGGLVALAVWRLRGARGLPLGAVGVVAVAALSLILPLAA